MKEKLVLGLTGILIVLGGMVWGQSSQSMPGLQTSFPAQRQGLRVSPTPRASSQPGRVKILRPFHPTPTPFHDRFFSLQPTPHPTPIRSQKKRPKPPSGAATLPAPRKIHYHSLYQDPTPTGSRAAH